MTDREDSTTAPPIEGSHEALTDGRPRLRCYRNGKRCYACRLEAESVLATVRAQWRRAPDRPRREAQPPIRVYRCPACAAWHLTSLPKAV